MPYPRRLRLVTLAAAASLFIVFFYANPFSQDFYHKTIEAMDNPLQRMNELPVEAHIRKDAATLPADIDGDGDVDEDDEKLTRELQQRLHAAAKAARESANEKVLKPDPPHKIVGVGNSAAGQQKIDKVAENVAEKVVETEVKKEETKPAAAAAPPPPAQKELTEKEKAVKEVDEILKKAPVVIFSKSYCPFSKRAKGLLLDKYHLTPPPHVVELDEHPMGSAIQDVLLERTGRRTVPNVMVQGTSIGGADDLALLDEARNLITKVEELGKESIKITERL